MPHLCSPATDACASRRRLPRRRPRRLPCRPAFTDRCAGSPPAAPSRASPPSSASPPPRPGCPSSNPPRLAPPRGGRGRRLSAVGRAAAHASRRRRRDAAQWVGVGMAVVGAGRCAAGGGGVAAVSSAVPHLRVGKRSGAVQCESLSARPNMVSGRHGHREETVGASAIVKKQSHDNKTHALLASPLALRSAEKRNSAVHRTPRERPVTIVRQQALGQAHRVHITHSSKPVHLVPVRARRHG